MKGKRQWKRVLASAVCAAMLLGNLWLPGDISHVVAADQTCEHHTHDGECGYVETGICTYECQVCKVQEFINALPEADKITADNAGEVSAQLKKIDEAKVGLSDEDMGMLNADRYTAAGKALAAINDTADNSTEPVENEEYVAQIGSTGYVTLDAAIKAANDAETDVTVKLLKDVNLAADLGIGAEHAITIDLAEKTINVGNCQIYTQNTGVVTFTGDGKIVSIAAEDSSTSYPIYVFSGSSVVIKGLCVQGNYGVYACGSLDIQAADINTKQWGLAINQAAQVTIGSLEGNTSNEIKIISESGNCIGTQAAQGGSGMNVVINSGTFSSTNPTSWSGGPVYWASHGTLTINGGEFSGQNNISAAVYQKNGTININGGYFSDKDAIKLGAEATDCTEISLNITDGVFVGSRSAFYFKTTALGSACKTFNINISGGVFSHTNEGPTIYESLKGDVIKPSMSISGGLFDEPVLPKYCAIDYVPYTILTNDNKYTVASEQSIERIKDVSELVEVLPDAKDIKASDVAAINAAKAAYDALTDAEKALVSDEDKAKLDAAVKALAALNQGKDPTPGKDDNSGNSSSPNKGTNTSNKNGIVQTGDSANVLLWVILAFAAIGAVAGVIIYRRQNRHN